MQFWLLSVKTPARESLAELLRGEGYEVYEAADGSAAITLIDQLDLDLALTDLMMGGSDGWLCCGTSGMPPHRP